MCGHVNLDHWASQALLAAQGCWATDNADANALPLLAQRRCFALACVPGAQANVTLRRPLVRVKIKAVSLHATIAEVHPDGRGALEEMEHKPIANRRGQPRTKVIWLPQMRRRPCRSAYPLDRRTMHPRADGWSKRFWPTSGPMHLLMERAHEVKETRKVASNPRFIPVVPPQRCGSNSGSTTGRCPIVVTKSRGCFGAPRDFLEDSRTRKA